jgi:predicted ester cyclase
MSTRANKALVRRLYEEVLNGRDLGRLAAVYALDIVDHGALPGQPPGLSGVVYAARLLLDAFPDIRFSVEAQLAEGDLVATRWRAHGTHRDTFLGIPATGRPVAATGIALGRIAGGRIAESWLELDMLGILQRLGAVIAPAHGRPTRAAPRATGFRAESGRAPVRKE